MVVDASRISLDANRLCQGTQRRFFSGFLESLGTEVHVSPTAVAEVVAQVRIAEDDFWSTRLERGTRSGKPIDLDQRGRIQLAVQREAEAWAREMLSPNTHQRLVLAEFRSEYRLSERYEDIRRRLPQMTRGIEDRRMARMRAAAAAEGW